MILWYPPEIEEAHIEVGGLTWHIKPKSFWDTTRYLAEHTDDQDLAQMAVMITGLTAGDRHFDLSVDEARASIARLSAPQLIEFTEKLKALSAIQTTPFSCVVPEPHPTPHWKRPIAAADRVPEESRGLLEKALAIAKEELADESLSMAKTEHNLSIVIKGLEKVQKEEAPPEESNFANGDLYPSRPSSIEDEVKEEPIKAPRKFVLAEILSQLYPAITLNLLLFPGTWGENTLKLRYVGRRETTALNVLYSDSIERERIFCAMSIACVNNSWCLSSITPSPLAMEVVDSWRGPDVDNFYKTIIKIREYAASLLQYIESTPYTRNLRSFWDTNKQRDRWWDENLSGVPGISRIPPLEHIDAFMQECLDEEAEQTRISEDEKLSLQVAGLSNELSQSLNARIKEAYNRRSQHINFMLYNEIPKLIQEESSDPTKVNIPLEVSQEDLVAHIEDMHQGKTDFHDTMLLLMRKRLAIMDKLHPKDVPILSPAPESKADAYDGGTHYASPSEIMEKQRLAREERASMDKEIYEFSSDVVSSIAKQRKRSLLLSGKDPYNETDESIDLGPASRITRTKNF